MQANIFINKTQLANGVVAGIVVAGLLTLSIAGAAQSGKQPAETRRLKGG